MQAVGVDVGGVVAMRNVLVGRHDHVIRFGGQVVVDAQPQGIPRPNPQRGAAEQSVEASVGEGLAGNGVLGEVDVQGRLEQALG